MATSYPSNNGKFASREPWAIRQARLRTQKEAKEAYKNSEKDSEWFVQTNNKKRQATKEEAKQFVPEKKKAVLTSNDVHKMLYAKRQPFLVFESDSNKIAPLPKIVTNNPFSILEVEECIDEEKEFPSLGGQGNKTSSGLNLPTSWPLPPSQLFSKKDKKPEQESKNNEEFYARPPRLNADVSWADVSDSDSEYEEDTEYESNVRNADNWQPSLSARLLTH